MKVFKSLIWICRWIMPMKIEIEKLINQFRLCIILFLLLFIPNDYFLFPLLSYFIFELLLLLLGFFYTFSLYSFMLFLAKIFVLKKLTWFYIIFNLLQADNCLFIATSSFYFIEFSNIVYWLASLRV